jgi:hypothetical protein
VSGLNSAENVIWPVSAPKIDAMGAKVTKAQK